MLNFDDIAVDPDKARSGVWMDHMGGRFLLARKGPEYQAKVSKLYLENREVIDQKDVEAGFKIAEIYRTAFIDHVLLDWDQIVDKNKNPVPYSKELATKLISDPRQYELVEALERFSLVHHNYQEVMEDQVAEEVKNIAVS